MRMLKVLLVEDDPMITGIITYYLEMEGRYAVTAAQTAGEAMAMSKRPFDVILMDILLPDANGIDLCSFMRRWHDGPILFISCLDDSDTIVNALAQGGDDFLTKPFDNRVLDARIQASLRRYHQEPRKTGPAPLSCGDFTLDEKRRAVVRGDRTVRLSATEYRILAFLMQNPGRCYTPRELYEQVWGVPSMGDTRTVLVHIHNLRQKLEEDPNEPRFIKLIWGQGYTFDPQGKAQNP